MKSLATYIKAGFSCLYTVSHEEDRIIGSIREMADELKYSLWSWSCTEGLKSSTGDKLDKTEDPGVALKVCSEYQTTKAGKIDPKPIPAKSIIVFKDFHLFLKSSNPLIIRRMREAINVGRATQRHIIILGCTLNLPAELEKDVTVIEFGLPTRAELLEVAKVVASSAKLELNGNTEAILDAGSGLTTSEFADAASYAFVETGKLDPKVISKIKADTIKKNGIVELVNTDIDIKGIGGLGNIKTWLNKRVNAFGKKAKDYGLPMPKGFLSIGIAGCGKTLIGKATANLLGVPLLKLDGGKIFGSLVGASEQNMRTALSTAEAIAPCVLMIDELEKALSGSKSSNSSDGGTTSRVLGTFLQWMQDKTAPVFVVATANNVSDLPPELLRRGRFDQLFFVDLPTAEERAEIWSIHISKHGRKPEDYDVSQLAEASDGYTGAEIESAVVDGLYSAFDAGNEPTNKTFFMAAASTIPLSKTMAEQITMMREWADGRAIMASEPASSAKSELVRKIG